MRHREVRALLYEYIRGELDPARSRRIQEHLARCNRCFAEYQVLKEGIRAVPSRREKASGQRSELFWRDFSLSVEQRLQVKHRRIGLRRRLWDEAEWFFLFRKPYAIALATSVALVVFAAVLWFGKVSPVSTEPPRLTATENDSNKK